MMANTETAAQSHPKLAPIFALKTNRLPEVVNEVKSKKRKYKKSPKVAKPSKKIARRVCCENVIVSRRRSQRLKEQVEQEKTFNYNEDSDEEVNHCEEESVGSADKINDSVVVEEEDSKTVDYWDDVRDEQYLKTDSTDDEIEIIDTKTVATSSQESTVYCQPSDPRECLLWTDKYKPTNTSEIIGHKVAVNRLKSWIEEWGRSESNNDSEEDSENGCNESNTCLLICGLTGCGKTSMVYAVAEELKYEVFELNASIKRNGRVIAKVLGEATQSHHMQRNNDLSSSSQPIYTFFKSVSNNTNSVDCDVKVEKVITSKKKSKTKGIMSYFSRQSSTETCISSKPEPSDTEVETIHTKTNSVVKSTDNQQSEESLAVPKVLSIASKSLILFDDIDIMIDDDSNGFWSAFNKIIETTKKPVIMTATQYVPYIRKCVNQLQVLTLNKPNSGDTISALTSICDKEFEESDSIANESVCQYLSETFDNDIRRSINELQFGTDWQHMPHTDTRLTSHDSSDDKSLGSHYNSLLFADIMQTQFKISTDFESRDNWMKCKPNPIQDNYRSSDLAKDILETLNDLSDKLRKTSVEKCRPIDNQSIEAISRYLSPNTSLRTVITDYCPHLAFICQSEVDRRAQLANHSRRSRRFTHHLDSVGVYIHNAVKTKLISAFASKIETNPLEEVNPSVEQKDDYFYE